MIQTVARLALTAALCIGLGVAVTLSMAAAGFVAVREAMRGDEGKCGCGVCAA